MIAEANNADAYAFVDIRDASCGAFRSSQCTAEGALMGLQPCMQGVRGLVHDAEQMDAKQPSVLEK